MVLSWLRGRRANHFTGKRDLSRPHASRWRPRLEALEDRQLLSTYMVTNTNDSGAGSFRQAILDSNMHPGQDAIHFHIGDGGSQRIVLQSALPPIVDPVLIDASTQPGYAGAPLIVLNGVLTAQPSVQAPTGFNGLTITGGNTLVRGLVIRSFGGSAIELTGGDNNVIVGNYLGTDLSGSLAFGNGQNGIYITHSSGNIIGGPALADHNVIAANHASGIFMENGSVGNVVAGNFIGVSSSGAAPLSNGFFGILVSASLNTVIGGTSAGQGNVISGNGDSGIRLDSGTTGTRIQGNLIGTDLSGLKGIGNGVRGILVSGAFNNQIGGTVAGAMNVISSNGLAGVTIDGGSTGNGLQGNRIGTDATGLHPLGNGSVGIRISASAGNIIGGISSQGRNLISANLGTGIWIDSGASGNQVQGNLIGTDATGTVPLGNHTQGILISGSFSNLVGGTVAGATNLISGNGLSGVVVIASTGTQIQGNLIGTDLTGANALGNQGSGIRLAAALSSVVGGTTPGARNLVSANTGDGVTIDTGSSGNLVEGNFIGTDQTGMNGLGNGGRGIVIMQSSNNTIGGPSVHLRNLISGNGLSGVVIAGGASSNQVEGNYIGTDATGQHALGNAGMGVRIGSGVANLIGGTVQGAGNIIAGNGNSGVQLDTGATANQVQGNLIGTDITRTMNLGNSGFGVRIIDSVANTIGGPTLAAGNAIAYNTLAGVSIEGPASLRNTVMSDLIFANASGVVLANGGNHAEVPPLLTSGTAGATTSLQGQLATIPNASFTIDFYANETVDAGGAAEGGRFLGAITVKTDSTGHATFNITLLAATSVGEIVTAIATDPFGNTSPFSLGLVL